MRPIALAIALLSAAPACATAPAAELAATAREAGHRRATGQIEVKTFEAVPYDAGPTNLNELRVTETFTGDILGDGAARFLQAVRGDGSASFVAIERVTGTLAGRHGSFLLQDAGTLVGQKVVGTWFVIPRSGTDELTGLRGEGGFEAVVGQRATYTLDTWWDRAADAAPAP